MTTDVDLFGEIPVCEAYRPANSDDGMWFEEKHCERCLSRDNCAIWDAAQTYLIGEPQYPKQWVYGLNDEPTCTAFVESLYEPR